MATFLHLDFASLWGSERGLRAWLQGETRRALAGDRGLRVVLVPSRSWVHAIQRQAAREQVSLGGISFWTPAVARGWLTKEFPPARKIADRATLLLLMVVAAREGAVGERSATATAVSLAPESLLGALDVLDDAGVEQLLLGNEELERLAWRFNELLWARGFQRVQAFDLEVSRRAAEEVAGGAAGRVRALFVCGFDGANWPQWPLLQSMARLAHKNTVVAIHESETTATDDVQSVFVGAWEAVAGRWQLMGCVEDPSGRPGENAAQVVSARDDQVPAVTRGVSFDVGRTEADEARLAVGRAAEFITESPEAHVAICVPAAGSLSQEVARELEFRALPFHNGVPSEVPGFFEQPAWRRFTDFLEEPSVARLVEFLRLHDDPAAIVGMPLGKAEEIIDRLENDPFYDDLGVAVKYLNEPDRRPRQLLLGQKLAALPGLPAEAKFSAYQELVATMLKTLSWSAATAAIFHDPVTVRQLADIVVPRQAFVEWLRRSLQSFTQGRGNHGENPLARIALLTYADAAGLPWTHVLALGQNEGVFPGDFGTPSYLSESAFAALQAQFRERNAGVTKVGPDGEGSKALKEGASYLLGPLEKRWLAVQDFVTLLETATVKTVFMAAAVDEAQSRELRPSDTLARVHGATDGQLLTQERFQALAQAVAGTSLLTALPDASARTAFDRRRDPTTPFGPFDFGFDGPAPFTPSFTATTAERLLHTPANVFLKTFLGVNPRDQRDEEAPWNKAVGTWAHDWLAGMGAPGGSFVPFPTEKTILATVETKARIFREKFELRQQSLGLNVPDWWLGAWEEARQAALDLGRSVGSTRAGYAWLATEVDLKRMDLPTATGSGLRVHGRADLVLSTHAPMLDDGRLVFPAGATVLVVDYKIGTSQDALTPRSLVEKRKGVQLAVYARGFASLGASEAGLCILKPDGELKVQISAADAATVENLWGTLSRMQATGNYGMWELVRPEEEHGARSPMPLAVLPVEEPVLAAKWQLTHGIAPSPR